ncbi:MAG: Dihydrolipoamide dehydrogenase of pyruvate dehydrogenase complex (EC 1.8.1.4) [Olavius algarvensis Delta 4 endosymbiont]|nr:MAG: Dihydrolipoamide dehydrogenase of pyruvate dehydrogenase complex (EC 1.8.1.4) [Olavius algarvensis Delta 4 endosymbiont]
MTEQKNTQLVVIGAGPGGYAAAFLAADLGLQVTLVDPEENPGGVCLYRGCIPSKSLLHVAHLLHEARRAEAYGIDFAPPTIDLDRLRGWKEKVVDQLTGGLGQLCARRKIEHIRGLARFKGADTVTISTPDEQVLELRFEKAIIASGSRPVAVPGLGEPSARVLDSTGALQLDILPESLLVIGGGYIGLELGSVYAALGSDVSVVEMLPGLLTGADKDLVRVLKKRLDEQFAEIWTDTRVVSVEDADDGVVVVLENKAGETSEYRFDRVLVSVGRQPNTESLGLENTRVKIDEQGFIKTDARQQTAEPTIFAIGDVAGQPMLAHKASHEGRVAVEVIAGHKVAFDPAAIPAVVYTDPEIAWCGLTESEAKSRKITHKTVRFPWAASGRALSQNSGDGMTKLIVDPDSERILGIGLVGTGAGELIAEGVLAIEMAALASDLKLTIHPHPTLSETIMEAAEVFFGQATHVYRPLKKRP